MQPQRPCWQCAIYCMSMSTKRRVQEASTEFVNQRGEYYVRTLSEWYAPERVELSAGVLTIRSRLAYWSPDNPGRVIKPSRKLLDSFIKLADAADEVTTLGDLHSASTPSQEAICAFANRYGGLQIFCEPLPGSRRPVIKHLEYCAVWRYFAQVMGSLLRIAAALYRGGSGRKEDWENIHQVPAVMRQTVDLSTSGRGHPFPEGDEQTWLSLAHYAGKRREQNRRMFGHLVNTLLGLGAVRPWFTWLESSRSVSRPEIRYSSQSLLSQLVLQLCLRVAQVDRFLVCVHCQTPYTPGQRAPKAGQRNFCPACREKGIPKAYAVKDFRKRQREARQR